MDVRLLRTRTSAKSPWRWENKEDTRRQCTRFAWERARREAYCNGWERRRAWSSKYEMQTYRCMYGTYFIRFWYIIQTSGDGRSL